mmetsp:Transcript_15302/g.30715  ORF Transcript_15302/g.30715 Transcript_15302/m.30715 type:complete len:463 (-) Transcript_15302:185-1573(-)
MPSIIAPPKKGGASSCAGAYTKLSQIGKGSFGAVWLVRHTRKGGDTLVLKEVDIKGASASEVRATKQEISVLKRVSHPNIIGYENTFEENGMVYIVMEYAAGGDLGRLITKRIKEKGARFSETEIRRYATQLGSALEYLHGEIHLLHRDIKPKNVFLSGSGDVRLGDFGLSKVLSKAEGTAETQVGTPLYMSPELCAGKPYDRSADVWAFGCTLYEAMSFVPPWSELMTPDGGLDGGMQGLIRHMKSSSLDIEKLRTHYSEEMVGVLSKLLAKRPADRLALLSLLQQLTEAPKHPASWGLSAEAQAALDAEASSKSQGSQGSRPSGASNSPPLTDCEDDSDVLVKGAEVHAAAMSLQRSFRRNAGQHKAQGTPPPSGRPANGGRQPLAGRPQSATRQPIVPAVVRTGAPPKPTLTTAKAGAGGRASPRPPSARPSSPKGAPPRPPSAATNKPARKPTPTKRA